LARPGSNQRPRVSCASVHLYAFGDALTAELRALRAIQICSRWFRAPARAATISPVGQRLTITPRTCYRATVCSRRKNSSGGRSILSASRVHSAGFANGPQHSVVGVRYHQPPSRKKIDIRITPCLQPVADSARSAGRSPWSRSGSGPWAA